MERASLPPWDIPTAPFRAAEPYTGPHTGDQLSALEVLEGVARRQAATAVMPVLPPYTGPVTGELLELDDAAGAAPRGRHSGPSSPAWRVVDEHAGRFTVFSVIGAVVLVLGIAVQALLVWLPAGRYGSYAGQAVFSIEASFLLNWRFTWRDR